MRKRKRTIDQSYDVVTLHVAGSAFRDVLAYASLHGYGFFKMNAMGKLEHFPIRLTSFDAEKLKKDEYEKVFTDR